MGYFAGVAFKRIGQEVSFLIGISFIGLQGLAYAGYIKIDYGKVQNEVVKKLDVDGDGKLTVNDVYVFWDKVSYLIFNLLICSWHVEITYAYIHKYINAYNHTLRKYSTLHILTNTYIDAHTHKRFALAVSYTLYFSPI
jgi:uncharacterized membrane protein (Fun14 family)